MHYTDLDIGPCYVSAEEQIFSLVLIYEKKYSAADDFDDVNCVTIAATVQQTIATNKKLAKA